jgi:hypothetical protein
MASPALNTALHTYLNDHLSGSSAAIQLLDHLIDSAPDEEERAFFRGLHAEVSADQRTLERILEESGGQSSTLRRAGGAVMDWLGRLKLTLDDPSYRQLSHLEALEMLALGILGKRSLWRALAAAGHTTMHNHDFAALERSAEDQHQAVEARRLDAARRVLGGHS